MHLNLNILLKYNVAVALAAALVGLRVGLCSTAGTVAFGGAFLVGIMAAVAAASSAAAAGVERTVVLAAALVDWRRAELSPTAGTIAAFGGAFLVGMAEM